jgi:hypothetical protein
VSTALAESAAVEATAGILPPQPVAAALWVGTGLFLARVVGQLWVCLVPRALHGFLPPMSRWYSGLLPYRFLLPAQLAIVAFQVAANLAVARAGGWIGTPHPPAGRVLWALAALYALGMAVRLVTWLARPPERRGVLIPIVFHFVLAGYVATLGLWHVSGTAA